MNYEFRPIGVWPGTLTRGRKRGLFKAGYNDTLKLLERELKQLSATQVVFQVALPESDIRLDGRPRAGSRPSHPGVIVSFQSKHGPLSYPCDRFMDWEDNLRAIALALEHLRTVDRYGVTRRGEQYRGWSQLPPPADAPAPMTRQVAIAIFRKYAPPNFIMVNRQQLGELYRIAVMAAHPDRGGNAEEFKKVQAAKEFLEKVL